MHRGFLANGVRLAVGHAVLFGLSSQQAGRQAAMSSGGSDVLVIRRRTGRQRGRLPDSAAQRSIASRAIVGPDLWGEKGGEQNRIERIECVSILAKFANEMVSSAFGQHLAGLSAQLQAACCRLQIQLRFQFHSRKENNGTKKSSSELWGSKG